MLSRLPPQWGRTRVFADITVSYFSLAARHFNLAANTPRTRIELRRAVHGLAASQARALGLVAALYTCWTAYLVAKVVPFDPPTWLPGVFALQWLPEEHRTLLWTLTGPVEGWGGLALLLTATYATLFRLHLMAWMFSPLRKRRPRPSHYAIPLNCAVVLARCHAASTASLPGRGPALLVVDRAATHLERALLRLPSDRRLAPYGSPRRKALKTHVALVCAALQKARVELDSDPASALSELAEMAGVILKRHADRRYGALLDDSTISGLEPVRSRELLRLLGTVTLVAGAAVGIGYLNPPTAAVPLLIGSFGLLVVSVIHGPRTHRPLDLLDSLRGIQRP